MLQPIHIIGASGRSGQALCRALLARRTPYIPVVRDPQRWSTTTLPGTPAVADLTTHTLQAALQSATTVVCCAHARYIPAILRAAPAARNFVFLGSTRKFTRWPDDHATGVQAGEEAFRGSDRFGVMLHPTMIYGAQGEDNVQRIARLLARLPFVPLPGGGRAMLRPIHQDDVTRCLRAAADTQWHRRESIVIAGEDRVSYTDFVRAVAAAAGLPSPRIITVPAGLLRAAAPLTRLLPGIPRVRGAEIRRLTEDKTFGIEPMRRLLAISPIGLTEGLARTFTPLESAS